MAWTTAEIPDQTGRTFVVTGANSGLGEQTSKVLASKGATVVMACRNVDKATAVSDAIDGDTRVEKLDLGDLASVREFAASQRSFDVLINNAGLMFVPEGRTADGFETQIGVNHLGHFALTAQLLDRIADRVVTVASLAHFQAKSLGLDDLVGTAGKYSRAGAYARSKLANLMFARELQRHLREKGSTVTSFAVHPGASATELASKTGTALDYIPKGAQRVFAQSALAGSHPTLYAATMPDADPDTYWGPMRMKNMRGPVGSNPSTRLSRDADQARLLWEASQEATGVHFQL